MSFIAINNSNTTSSITLIQRGCVEEIEMYYNAQSAPPHVSLREITLRVEGLFQD